MQSVNRPYEFADLSEYSFKDRLLIRAADLAFYSLISLIGLSARFEVIGWENHQKVEESGGLPIYVFWHDRIFLTTYWWRKRRSLPMSPVPLSLSSVQIATSSVAGTPNWRSMRPSSEAWRSISSLARLMRAGCTTAFTIDGPKGPRYMAKMGAVMLAKKSGHPIMPVTMALKRYWTLPSWDLFQIPKPFTKARVYVAPPIYVPADADEKMLAAKRDELQHTLDHLNRLSTEFADKV